MSTSYYGLYKPLTCLRIECSNQEHTRLSVWICGGHAGTLTVPTQTLKNFLMLFCSDHNCLLRTHWGGKDRGSVVTVLHDAPDETIVISEYGQLLTVGQVKARDGAKRSDGMPTELFGYEEAE